MTHDPRPYCYHLGCLLVLPGGRDSDINDSDNSTLSKDRYESERTTNQSPREKRGVVDDREPEKYTNLDVDPDLHSPSLCP